MSILDDFLAEHRWWPWLPEASDDGAPAKELYEAYRARMGELDRSVLSNKDFGTALRDAGFTPERRAEGNFYPGLTAETRIERARSGVQLHLWMKGWEEARRRADADHRARRHGGDQGVRCDHDVPEAVRESMADDVRASITQLRADGTVDRLIEDRYGPYLRWQPGQPHPAIAIERERRRRAADQAIAKASASFVSIPDRRAELRERMVELSAVYSEAIRREAEASSVVRGGGVVGTLMNEAPNDPDLVAALREARAESQKIGAEFYGAELALRQEEERIAGLEKQLAVAQAALRELETVEPAGQEPSSASAEDEW